MARIVGHHNGRKRKQPRPVEQESDWCKQCGTSWQDVIGPMSGCSHCNSDFQGKESQLEYEGFLDVLVADYDDDDERAHAAWLELQHSIERGKRSHFKLRDFRP
jgi:hypothetical protein